MSAIRYRDSKIYFESAGEGRKLPLVLLHGFMEDSQIWNPIVEDLKLERQVICIDLPGHGKSEGVASVHSMKLMAEVVFEVLKNLEIQKISIAGHSMGGYVSLEFLENFPMMLQSLVLINSTPIEDTVEKREIRDRSVKLVEENKRAYIKMAISNLFSESSRTKFASEIEDLKLRSSKMKVKNIQAALMGMKIRTNKINALKAFSGQKIILASEQDPILEIKDLQKVSKECECDFYRLKNGHNSYLEDRENLTQIMHFID